MSPTMQRYMKAQAVAMGEENGMFGGGMVSHLFSTVFVTFTLVTLLHSNCCCLAALQF
jgi:hypothetical protein